MAIPCVENFVGEVTKVKKQRNNRLILELRKRRSLHLSLHHASSHHPTHTEAEREGGGREREN